MGFAQRSHSWTYSIPNHSVRVTPDAFGPIRIDFPTPLISFFLSVA